ncbi:hypothetical protein B0H13DRAFT_2305443 [Mycena leptocephala]|nr:hypothetical protein B0H13DRAFT_2305443 [Mycena leptocephala]
MTGKYLPDFSGAVLKDWQLYYLITVTSNLLIVGMFYDNHVAVTYRTMLADPNLMVTNAMDLGVHPDAQEAGEAAGSTSEVLFASLVDFYRWMPRMGRLRAALRVAKYHGRGPAFQRVIAAQARFFFPGDDWEK